MWIVWDIIWMLLLFRRWRRWSWAGDGWARRVRWARLAGRRIVDDLLCQIKLVALLVVALYDVIVIEVDEKFTVVRVDVATLRLSLGNDVWIHVRILNVADLIVLLLMLMVHMTKGVAIVMIVMHFLGLVLLLQLLAQVLFMKMLMRFLRWFDNFVYCLLGAQIDGRVVGRCRVVRLVLMSAIWGRLLLVRRKVSASILNKVARADNNCGVYRVTELLWLSARRRRIN